MSTDHIMSLAPCGLRGCKNRPAQFPCRMSYKATKPGSVCHLSQHKIFQCDFCCLLGPLFVLTLVCVCMCSVSWLFWLSWQYLIFRSQCSSPPHGRNVGRRVVVARSNCSPTGVDWRCNRVRIVVVITALHDSSSATLYNLVTEN